ncbi:MAG TPA: bifunctional demethylmenaquinone methyltransferase/2-methoxy-6-polyprenyl-1,4-benzoquinol methylase UbiE [Vicinamibacterales bacterium]
MSVAVDKTPARIAAMFDGIAKRYDFLNHFLSAGRDRRWRAEAIRAMRLPGNGRVVDLCAGTADFAIAAANSSPGIHVIGVDFAAAMLAIGRDKIRAAGLADRVRLVRGDALGIPVHDRWADGATIGFGIRNVIDPIAALREIARVIKPGGTLAILEFGEPVIPGVRGLYNWYFRQVLPWLGRLVSKHESAYSYLPASVGTFPPPATFAAMISSQGFVNVIAAPLNLGIVYLYVATRA